MIFFGGKLSPICEKYFQKEYFVTNSLLKNKKKLKVLPRITIIAYNMKGCLRFYISIFEYGHLFG